MLLMMTYSKCVYYCGTMCIILYFSKHSNSEMVVSIITHKSSYWSSGWQ